MLRFRFQFLLLFLHYSSDEPSQFSHTIPLFSSVGGEGFVPFQWGAKSRTANSTCVTTSVTRASLVTSSWSSSSAPDGKLRYANNSNYKNDTIIRKEVYLTPAVLRECRRIIAESEVRNPNLSTTSPSCRFSN